MDYKRLEKVVHSLGYTGLRSPQVRPVQTLLQKESLICVLPTGCGKTAVFTIPTLYHNWRTLVISPLLALMENQAKSLNRMGVKAMEITSRTSQTANKLACELWANDKLRMLYVAPERLNTDMFTRLMKDYPPDHICVDECIHVDTLVTTLHGAKKASDVCTGESVLSFNERGELETDKVVSVCEKGTRPTWRLTTGRGITLLCTSNEKLYTPRGWVYLAEFLSDGQRLLDARERQNNEYSKSSVGSVGKGKEIYTRGENSLVVDSIDSIEYAGLLPVLDIETEKNHTFFANNVAVHNCHVLSAWGDDFRPDYTHIGAFIDTYKPSVVSAFTATATKHIVEDVRRVLRLHTAPFIFNYPRRNNLRYMSISKDIESPVRQCADLIRKYIKDGSAIVYCSTVKMVEALSSMLEMELHPDYGVVYYHGQMTAQSLKDMNNRDFMEGDAKVMVATKAFGMGVDKSDVRLVIEFDTSDSLESLAQQQGRAGRDGKEAHCITLWHPQSSAEYYNLFYANTRPSFNQIQRIYKLLTDTAAKSQNGSVKLTERQIAGICRINDKIVSSTMGLLDAQGIIRRESNSEDVYSIQFHVDPADEVYEGSYVRKIYDVVNVYGSYREDENIYDISMEALYMSLNRSKNTVQAWLRTCAINQQISYQTPYRGSVTFILKGLDVLDFEHIRKKRMLEDRRLQDVMNYCRLPDDEKQDHLIAYFREAVEND